MKNLTLLFVVVAMVACKSSIPDKNRLLEFTYENSKFIENKDYQIYLPVSYFKDDSKRYPVLYMMDGQNLFVDSLAYGGISWQIDRVADSLVNEGYINEFIIVGINNAGIKRFSEYMPQKPVEEIPQECDSLIKRIEHPVFSDNFLEFLVKELKPKIDQEYRTKAYEKDTYIAGSSMGGLISMYAICEYPEVFGNVICMSTHWIVSLDNSTPQIASEIQQYFADNLPGNKKVYFDYGTKGLDQYYEQYQLQANISLKKIGYTENVNCIVRKFENHDHNEYYWNKRLSIPLMFMFGKE